MDLPLVRSSKLGWVSWHPLGLMPLHWGFFPENEKVCSLRLWIRERVLTVVCTYAPNNSSEYSGFLDGRGSMLDRPGAPKCIVRVHWEHLTEVPVYNSHF